EVRHRTRQITKPGRLDIQHPITPPRAPISVAGVTLVRIEKHDRPRRRDHHAAAMIERMRPRLHQRQHMRSMSMRRERKRLVRSIENLDPVEIRAANDFRALHEPSSYVKRKANLLRDACDLSVRRPPMIVALGPHVNEAK